MCIWYDIELMRCFIYCLLFTTRDEQGIMQFGNKYFLVDFGKIGIGKVNSIKPEIKIHVPIIQLHTKEHWDIFGIIETFEKKNSEKTIFRVFVFAHKYHIDPFLFRVNRVFRVFVRVLNLYTYPYPIGYGYDFLYPIPDGYFGYSGKRVTRSQACSTLHFSFLSGTIT